MHERAKAIAEQWSAIHLSDMSFSNRHGNAGVAKRGACFPKNTEAKHIPDIQHMLGSGSLLQIVKV